MAIDGYAVRLGLSPSLGCRKGLDGLPEIAPEDARCEMAALAEHEARQAKADAIGGFLFKLRGPDASAFAFKNGVKITE